MVSGTLNHSLPEAIAAAPSVRADAGREHVDRAVRAGVRVAADHQVAGDDVALLGDELVAHALAHVVDGGAGALAELAHHRVERAHAFDRARRAVVHDHGDLLRVEDLGDAHLLERLDGQRRRAVLPHHEVDVRDDDVTGVRISTRVCREDLLGDCLSGQRCQPPSRFRRQGSRKCGKAPRAWRGIVLHRAGACQVEESTAAASSRRASKRSTSRRVSSAPHSATRLE